MSGEGGVSVPVVLLAVCCLFGCRQVRLMASEGEGQPNAPATRPRAKGQGGVSTVPPSAPDSLCHPPDGLLSLSESQAQAADDEAEALRASLAAKRAELRLTSAPITTVPPACGRGPLYGANVCFSC